MFGGAAEGADLTFVEYESNPGVTPELYAPYGRLTTWEQHRSARALLRQVEPDLLAMLSTGVRNQLALRREAARQGIRTIHLEHGYRLPIATQRTLSADRDKIAHAGGATGGRRSSLATNRFLACSLLRLPPREAARIARFALPSVGGASLETLGAAADLRRPDRYVSFSPECFAFHRELDRVPPELAERTVYVGVPQFDCFRSENADAEPGSGTVVLVDHQLHNIGFMGWNPAHHRAWVEGIHAAVTSSGRRLVVKAHPGERSSPWAEYTDGSVEVVPSIEELERRARSARVALGIMSTLQLPLAGLDHIATIAVEVHPRPNQVLSSRMVDAGVAHPVFSYEELRAALERRPRAAPAPAAEQAGLRRALPAPARRPRRGAADRGAARRGRSRGEGRGGCQVSELGLGTVQLGLPYGVSNRTGQPSEDEAAAILACALGSGVRTIDTAPAYGGAEELLGRLLPAGAAVRIVTKTPPLAGAAEVTEAECDAVRRSAERSLQRLRRDRLDALLVHHGSDLALPGGERLAGTLAELRDSGVAGRLGASVYDRAELDAARERLPLDLVQLPLNAFDQRLLRDGTLEELRREGVEVHVRSSFLQGLLLMGPEQLPAHLEAAEGPLRRYREERRRAGLGPIEAALGFVAGAPGVDVALVGANSAAELEQCVAALHGRPGPGMDYASLALEDPNLIDPRQWPTP